MVMLLFNGSMGSTFYASSSVISGVLTRADSASQNLAAFVAPHRHSGQNGLPYTILQWTTGRVSPSSIGLPERFDTNIMMP
jgi:hypothetical protein